MGASVYYAENFETIGENMREVKKIDTASDKFSALEHMIVRLEEKIYDNCYCRRT